MVQEIKVDGQYTYHYKPAFHVIPAIIHRLQKQEGKLCQVVSLDLADNKRPGAYVLFFDEGEHGIEYCVSLEELNNPNGSKEAQAKMAERFDYTLGI
jgi:hypothetical protein